MREDWRQLFWRTRYVSDIEDYMSETKSALECIKRETLSHSSAEANLYKNKKKVQGSLKLSAKERIISTL